ncbi:hypothetical protein [Janibacter anophelis]|uniref:hypothetical protein n=1 Tax=Janibacter anophelis TaxID=319054 RepID=UPI000836CA30|nr:hypothetical protein [Janibacter anophelis]
MTQNVITPSRRSVAKGAAWAVPAVAVAAAAPSLAASTTYCTGTPTFTIDVVCPPTDIDLLDGNSESLYFVVTNTSGCTVEAGQEFTLDTTNLAGVTVEGLNAINAGVAVFGADGRTGTLSQDLADGASVEIHVFPVADVDVNLAVIGATTLTIEAASLTQAYTLIEADAIGALAVTIAFCGGEGLVETLLDLLDASVVEVAEILLALGLS